MVPVVEISVEVVIALPFVYDVRMREGAVVLVDVEVEVVAVVDLVVVEVGVDSMVKVVAAVVVVGDTTITVILV